MLSFIFTFILNEKNKILQDVKKPPCETYLFNFHQTKIM